MGAQRKKKGAKKKECRSLWKLSQPWKSDKVACGNFFLMISTAAWKGRRKKRFGLSTVTTGPTTNNSTDNFESHCHLNWSHRWGALQNVVAMDLLRCQLSQ
jgi:hypothetical protein